MRNSVSPAISDQAYVVHANDNNLGAASWPLKELYEKGELDINEPGNRRNWQAALRFKKEYAAAKGEPDNDTAMSDWREVMDEFLEVKADDMMVRSDDTDDELSLTDDCEFDDLATAEPSFCDNAGWNVHRDLPPHASATQGKQIIASIASEMWLDFPLLHAVINRGWTMRKVGETEGYTDKAAAAACGKGMVRAALRRLAAVFATLDQLEAGNVPEKPLWPLVGTLVWNEVEAPTAAWKCAA